MKESKHHTYDEALEMIEQIIEGIDPEETVMVSDITGRIKLADQTSNITKATIMLLKKYGVDFETR